jgi:hypothetical protein
VKRSDTDQVQSVSLTPVDGSKDTRMTVVSGCYFVKYAAAKRSVLALRYASEMSHDRDLPRVPPQQSAARIYQNLRSKLLCVEY